MSKNAVIATLVVIVAFISGALAGLYFGVHHFRRPGGRPLATEAMTRRLDHALDLTDDQEKQIRAILKRRHDNIENLWNGVHPRVRTEIEATNSEIERILNDEQREKFKKMRMHLRHREKGSERRRPARE